MARGTPLRYRQDGVPARKSAPTNPQPNGRPTQADVPTGLPYGEAGQLKQQIANTPPPPPGITPQAHAARQALSAMPQPNLTPLFAPTERPNESVLAGAARGGVGPVNPMALPQTPNSSVSQILSQVAAATNSPKLRELAAQAMAVGQ